MDIEGTVKKLTKPVESCSIKNIEIGVNKFYVVSRANNVLPFQMFDAQKNENIQEGTPENQQEESKDVVVKLKTRLDNRVMDLRTPASQAIFRVQSKIC